MKKEGKIQDHINSKKLVGTPISTNKKFIEKIDNGDYLHFNIEASIKNIIFLCNETEIIEQNIELSFNIDSNNKWRI